MQKEGTYTNVPLLGEDFVYGGAGAAICNAVEPEAAEPDVAAHDAIRNAVVPEAAAHDATPRSIASDIARNDAAARNAAQNRNVVCANAPIPASNAAQNGTGACNNAPIGIFDSGYGGLTVARAIAQRLPHEDFVYVGDSARCPYGPRDLHEVDGFVQQIGGWLIGQGVKLLIIACNTATAAGLAHAQQTFSVPVVGVVEPGARAAVRATRNRRVGVIATKGTIESGAYSTAIRNLDAGITVFSTPAPRFVEIAELGVRMAEGPVETFMSEASKVYIRPEFQKIAIEYLDPLRRCNIDTLVLGCTHYPLLKALIGGVVGHDVTLISSASETAHDVAETLARRGQLASCENVARWRFFTTGNDVEEFRRFGSRVFKTSLENVEHLDLP